MNKIPSWLIMTFACMFMNGIWGALIELPEKRIYPTFPTSLGYVVWSISFIPCALYILYKVNWNLDCSFIGICKGLLVGLLGAGGQFVLFEALRSGPAYIIFPIISVYPLVTIILSIIFLKEKANKWASFGISLAFVSIFLLSLQESGSNQSESYRWLLLAVAGFFMWGLQSFFAKMVLQTMSSESVLFFIMVSNLIFVPLALKLTDFSQPIGWQTGLYLTFIIQFLNVAGVVLMVYALRKGKVIIISPVSALAPMITTILSLIIYARIPYLWNSYGIIIAMLSLGMITYGEFLNEKRNRHNNINSSNL